MKRISWIEDLVRLFTKTEEDTITLTDRLSAAVYDERQGAFVKGLVTGLVASLFIWIICK